MFSIGGFAIINDALDRVLLCHRRDYDLWNLPGGGVEHGESPWDAVVREVFEETGLYVEFAESLGIYNKPTQGEIVFSFRCNVVSGELALNDGADRIEYFALNDIPQNTSRKQVERIRKAFTSGRFPVLRDRTGEPSIPR